MLVERPQAIAEATKLRLQLLLILTPPVIALSQLVAKRSELQRGLTAQSCGFVNHLLASLITSIDALTESRPGGLPAGSQGRTDVLPRRPRALRLCYQLGLPG
jgi:hypothetical protein